MPRYRFTGMFETVLTGLSHGVNAVLHREKLDENGELVHHGQPDGSTVVVAPGDEVSTDEPYPHAHLVNVDTDKRDEAETEVQATVDPTQATAESAVVPPGAVENTGGEATTQTAADAVPQQSETADPSATQTEGQE